MNLILNNTLPNTGEAIKNNALYIAIAIIILAILLFIWKRKNNKDDK